tara:strand:- start:1132 stop:2250 length:1119 start_codon:yes stop_codon:yes gene_type:complete
MSSDTIDKLRDRAYTDFEEFTRGIATGKAKQALSEPNPAYPLRPGEIIGAKGNNNTLIVMGRDRNPFGPSKRTTPHGSEENPNVKSATNSDVSGFSDHMAAGAIDIIVGRGAPFPLEKISNGYNPDGLPPLYTTRNPVWLKGSEQKLIKNLGTPQQKLVDHPGYIMDAARIYISQMCQIDDYFKTKPKKIGLADDEGPHSAIMIKADKLRLHSRRDIRIIAGGDADAEGQYYDSNGYKISEAPGKIHLVIGNNKFSQKRVRDTSDAVRATELVECLGKIVDQMQGISTLLHNFLKGQKKVNEKFAGSVYGTALGMTTFDPIAQATGCVDTIQKCVDLIQMHALKTSNIPNIKKDYLLKGAAQYIGSRHVTLN